MFELCVLISYPNPGIIPLTPSFTSDPSKMTLSERVRLFDRYYALADGNRDSPSPPATPPPRHPGGDFLTARRQQRSKRRLLNQQDLASRFQTQPITVDEVQEASRRNRSIHHAAGGESVAALRSLFGGVIRLMKRGHGSLSHHSRLQTLHLLASLPIRLDILTSLYR